MTNDNHTKVAELKEWMREFRDERDWKQFHNVKDLATAISVEAGELLELFLWQKSEDFTKQMQEDPEFREEVSDELADVINLCMAFANIADLDVATLAKNKIEKAKVKYPIEKAKGRATKYTKF